MSRYPYIWQLSKFGIIFAISSQIMVAKHAIYTQNPAQNTCVNACNALGRIWNHLKPVWERFARWTYRLLPQLQIGVCSLCVIPLNTWYSPSFLPIFGKWGLWNEHWVRFMDKTGTKPFVSSLRIPDKGRFALANNRKNIFERIENSFWVEENADLLKYIWCSNSKKWARYSDF